MSLTRGTRLGAYEIVTPIGAGGMGEVYKATDTRLNRTVAVKVLPQQSRDNPNVKQRFHREAEAVAALEHPHICILYDIGHEGGIDFLVMEYLEGWTLANQLLSGPLPLHQALEYAIQIADALDKAHRHGVVHRDVKPDNIMLTKGGAKLLDFGIAKADLHAGGYANGSIVQSTGGTTAYGKVVGSLLYMAPEQLEGRETDTRTDVFAFGAVLYEMVSGRKAFEARIHARALDQINFADPPRLSTISPALDNVIWTCLAPNPRRRNPACDVLSDLKRISAAISTSLVQFMLSPPENAVFATESGLAVSPDGRRLAFVALREGKKHIWLRSFDLPRPQPLPDTEDGDYPFWSPDGRFLAFFARGILKKISASGGPSLTLCEAADPRGGTWSREDVILFAQIVSGRNELCRVSAEGGEAVSLTIRDPLGRYASAVWPSFLPNGQHFLYHTEVGAFIGSLQSTDMKHVSDERVAFSLPGYLVFACERTLFVRPFDRTRLEIGGEAVAVLNDIRETIADEASAFSVSENGVLAYSTEYIQPSIAVVVNWPALLKR